jgi:hypothetical protein
MSERKNKTGGDASVPQYVGVELASESGRSACAILRAEPDSSRMVVELPKAGYRQAKGLLSLAELMRGAERSAVGTCFGYPDATIRLLQGEGAGSGSSTERLRFRVADVAIQTRYEQLGLPASLANSPMRTEQIWRTLSLLECVGADLEAARDGRGPVVETCARLAMVELLASRRHLGKAGRELILNYRRRSRSDGRGTQARRQLFKVLVEAFHGAFGKGTFVVEQWRSIDSDPVILEALYDAVTSYALHRGAVIQFPGPYYPVAVPPRFEGCVVVPDWNALLR